MSLQRRFLSFLQWLKGGCSEADERKPEMSAVGEEHDGSALFRLIFHLAAWMLRQDFEGGGMKSPGYQERERIRMEHTFDFGSAALSR